MLYFWVLSMSHRQGCSANSVYVNLSTLMQYWGHKLTDHSDLRHCEIKQEYVSHDRLSDDQETLICVEIFSKRRDRYERLYFVDVKAIADWQEHFEDYPEEYDFGNMTVHTLHINRE